MGYYWDYVTEKWNPIDHDRQLTSLERARIERRGDLIEDLLTEIKRPTDSITALYACLLARALASSDEILTREFSQTVAQLTTEKQHKAA